MQIFNGAPIPAGADAVVMQERVQRDGPSVTLAGRPKPHENNRFAGEDMCAGQQVLQAGRRLGAVEIAALAAAGCDQVLVQPRLRVAIFSTGDEVRSAGEALEDAAIWGVNSPKLVAAITAAGAEITEVIHGGDSLKTLRDTLSELSQRADVIVTTGGSSVGGVDFVKPAIAELGGEIGFSGAAVKPGKPVSFGRFGAAYWLGLPGNPVSALVSWTLFGPQVLVGLKGCMTVTPKRRHVVADRMLQHKIGRCELRLVTLAGFGGSGREVVRCPQVTKSARDSLLVDTDGLIFIPADTGNISQADLVEFLPFSN